MAYEKSYVVDFTGGENQSASPSNLTVDQCTLFRNADILDARAGFRRRSGTVLAHDTTDGANNSAIDRLMEFEFYKDGKRLRELIYLQGGTIYRQRDKKKLALNMGSAVDYEIVHNKMYVLGNGRYMVYDGDNMIDVTCSKDASILVTIRKCKYITQRGSRVFVAGNPEAPNALYFSELNDPTYFSGNAGNPILAITDDGDVITGLKEYHGALLAFKRRAIFGWFGNSPKKDVVFKRLNVHTGTTSYRTICNVDDRLLYLGDDGIYMLKGAEENVMSTKKLSGNLDPTIKKLTSTERACAVYYENKYMVGATVGDSPHNNSVLVYFNNGKDSMGVYDSGIYANDFVHSLGGELYHGASNASKIVKHDSEANDDMGTAIAVRVHTRPLQQASPIDIKKYKRGYIMFKQIEEIKTTLDVTVAVDYNRKTFHGLSADESLVWDKGDWDNAVWDFNELVVVSFRIKEKGKGLIFEMEDATAGNALFVYGLAVEYKNKKADRGVGRNVTITTN